MRLHALTLRLAACLLCVLIGTSPAISQTHVVTPSDCISTRYVTGLWISRSGGRAAYLVKAPDIAANRNNYRLYVMSLRGSVQASESPIIEGTDISSVHWIDHDTRLAMLMKSGPKKTLVIVDLTTHAIERPIERDASLSSYSIDEQGGTIAYSVEAEGANKYDTFVPTEADQQSGYPILFSEEAKTLWQASSVYIQHRKQEKWLSPTLIQVENPFSHVVSTQLRYLDYLSLSPDGRRLFLTYIPDKPPEQWLSNPIAKTAYAVPIMVLYDVTTGKTAIPFNMGYSHSQPLWSRDSSTIFLNTYSPVGSKWESEDIANRRISYNDVHLFAVNVVSGKIAEVLNEVPNHQESPLYELPNGDILVRTGRLTVSRFARDGEWSRTSEVTLPGKDDLWSQSIAANGTVIVYVGESIASPPNLFRFTPGSGAIQRLTDLNPELANAQFASVEKITWATKDRLVIDGFLFKPLGYEPGQQYPLVIQTKGLSGWFACDDGLSEYPSFAPQPIAASGMFYLARAFSPDWNYQEDIDKRPPGYPGGIGEAAEQMDIWDSAVEALVHRGLVDPDKVGIIGFSRTGWDVEFSLVHSKTKFAAATAADNIHYSLMEYWLNPSAADTLERMYGGPPYGESGAAWHNYSISFNLDKIHTPLLLESMGGGHRELSPDVIPRVLAPEFELFTGLARLGKPVDLYYYPDEDHTPDHPKARLASITRNLDWFRFWLQGYEDQNRAKVNQYQRWRSLRNLTIYEKAPTNSSTDKISTQK